MPNKKKEPKEEIAPLSKDAQNFKFGIYKHFKGKEYKIITIARDSETLEELVVYGSLDDKYSWIRPFKNFLENVERDDHRGLRFEYLRD